MITDLVDIRFRISEKGLSQNMVYNSRGKSLQQRTRFLISCRDFQRFPRSDLPLGIIDKGNHDFSKFEREE